MCALLAVSLVALGYATDSAQAEDAQPGVQSASPTDASPTGRVQTPEQRRKKRERHQQYRREWWDHAHDILFHGIDLDAAQSEQVEEIIEANLENRTRGREVTAALRRLGPKAKAEMREPLREQLREVQAQRMTQSQIFDALRELLSDAQRPAFDLNRAQLVAEGQQRDPAARNAPLSDPPGPSS